MKQKKGNDPHYVAQVILARRDHAEAEIRAKLARKNFSQNVIEETIVWLKAQHLINDEEYIRSYINGTLSMKAVGPRWLRFKLRQKGLPTELINKVMSETYTEATEKECAQRALEQWRSAHPKYSDDRNRLMRFLLSRGFSSSVISHLVGGRRSGAP